MGGGIGEGDGGWWGRVSVLPVYSQSDARTTKVSSVLGQVKRINYNNVLDKKHCIELQMGFTRNLISQRICLNYSKNIRLMSIIYIAIGRSYELT